MDTYNTLIYGNGRVVATIGIEDLLIVDTHDVLLICPRSRAQDVKAIVAQVRRQHGSLV
jgi:mannose-1-phosphate guanylyltransferase